MCQLCNKSVKLLFWFEIIYSDGIDLSRFSLAFIWCYLYCVLEIVSYSFNFYKFLWISLYQERIVKNDVLSDGTKIYGNEDELEISRKCSRDVNTSNKTVK